MKILICSDSHKRLDIFQKIIEKELPEIILFAGDHSTDAIDMSYVYSDIEFFIVRGNTDYFDKDTADKLIIEIEKEKVLLVHGHLFGVKSYMHELENEAESDKVNICIFGHTHIPYYKEKNKIKYVNPGALQNGNYAVWEGKKIELKNIVNK
jgi:putative phosphoesterase